MITVEELRLAAQMSTPGHYPPVAVDEITYPGMPMLVCANGHRWSGINPHGDCHQCSENERYRRMGRTECEVEGCDNLVTCRQPLWDAGNRRCQQHWIEQGEYKAEPVTLASEGSEVMAQFNPRNRWNGWIGAVALDEWAVEKVLTDYVESGSEDYTHEWVVDEDLDILLIITDNCNLDEDEQPYVETIVADEDGLFQIGAFGWTWYEDLDESDDEATIIMKHERAMKAYESEEA